MKIRLFFIALFAMFFVLESTAQKKNYNIGILLDRKTEKVNALLDLAIEQIIAVVGEDAEISFSEKNVLTNNFDIQLAEKNYQTLLTNETDIILAFGITNGRLLSKVSTHDKPTILFGAVNKDFINLDFTKRSSNLKNFTYLIESVSFVEDIKTFKELTEFKTLGIAIDRPMAEILPLESTLETIVKNLNVDYKIIPFDDADDIINNLENVDAVYLAGGFFLSSAEITQLADHLIEKKLPSFTNLGIEEVQLGLMATNQSEENLDQILRRIALTIEGYVNDSALAEMPVYIDYSPRLTLNFRTADAVNVPIKYSLIANTSFVGNNKSQSKNTLSLLEVIDGVLEQNLLLKAQKMDIDLAGQEVKTAKSNYLPSLTASGTGTYVDPEAAEQSFGQNPEFSTAGNITLQQTVFSEAANANITIQKKLQKAQEESFNAFALDAVFDASNAYFAALILKANVEIQMRNLELTKQNLKIAKQNFESGESGKSDMLRFKSQMAQDTQAVVEAVNQLEQGFIALKQLLNLPLDSEIDVDDVSLNDDMLKDYQYDELADLLDNPATKELFIAFLTQEAKENAPELKSLQYNLEAVERSLKLNTSGRFLPTLALQGQYNRIFNRSGAGSTPLPLPGSTLLDQNYSVALNVSIPILNQNRNNINQQTSIIQQDQLKVTKENTELAIDSNIRNSVLNLVNQISNIDLSGISEEAANEALELTKTAYASGAVTIIQLIDAQNNYVNAQLARTTALYNFLISGLQLERFLGYYFILNSDEANLEFNQRFMEFFNAQN